MYIEEDEFENFHSGYRLQQQSHGRCTVQKYELGERVIAFLSKAEQNYCVTRKELLTLFKSTENFHKYFYRQKFLLLTDRAALQWIMSFKEPEGQLARWL